jgi:hypothetical protein
VDRKLSMTAKAIIRGLRAVILWQSNEVLRISTQVPVQTDYNQARKASLKKAQAVD